MIKADPGWYVYFVATGRTDTRRRVLPVVGWDENGSAIVHGSPKGLRRSMVVRGTDIDPESKRTFEVLYTEQQVEDLQKIRDPDPRGDPKIFKKSPSFQRRKK